MRDTIPQVYPTLCQPQTRIQMPWAVQQEPPLWTHKNHSTTNSTTINTPQPPAYTTHIRTKCTHRILYLQPCTAIHTRMKSTSRPKDKCSSTMFRQDVIRRYPLSAHFSPHLHMPPCRHFLAKTGYKLISTNLGGTRGVAKKD